MMRSRAAVRPLKAATIVTFLGLLLPTITFVAVFSVDFVRVMSARHEISNAARAAARVAATAYQACPAEQPNRCALLDANAARARAVDSLETAEPTFGPAIQVNDITVTIDQAPDTGQPESAVTVTVDFTVTDLVFAPALLAITNQPSSRDLSTLATTTSRTAFVCIPDRQSGDNIDGTCVLPR